MSDICYWFELYPDISSPIGGVKQIHRLVEALGQTGRNVTIVQHSSSFHPGWFQSSVRTISLLKWSQLDLDAKSNLVIIPETFISPKYCEKLFHPELKRIIFNQNSSYTFGLPTSTSSHSLSFVSNYYTSSDVLGILTISIYDYNFLCRSLNVSNSSIFRLANPVEPLFQPCLKKSKTISIVSRKNPNHIKIFLELASRHSELDGWEFQLLHGLTQSELASKLAKSLVFLDFGYPEGFGLPAAEAIASCCYLIGYDGLGGRELYDIAHEYRTGVSIPFGDFTCWLTSLLHFVRKFEHNTSYINDLSKQLLAASSYLRSQYSFTQLVSDVEKSFNALEERLSSSSSSSF